MTNGKGSKRRPALVSEKVIEDNWTLVFGGNRPRKAKYIIPWQPSDNEYSHLGDCRESLFFTR